MAYYVAPGIIFPVLEPPYIIYRNPTCKELSNNIAAREHPRAGSKQMATYQAVAQTQSSWSSSCERTSPHCGRKQMMATYQEVVAQTQSRCLIAARERPRAGSKQMSTYQAVVAQTQSSSSSSNLCCSVATQTWSAHVACSLLLVHIFSHTQQQYACCTSLPPSIFPISVFFPLKINWRN